MDLWFRVWEDYKMKRGLFFGAILVAALAAFEVFNFSTTDAALTDFLGEARFLGVRWATILAIAFCGIDFAGLARLFTPEKGQDSPVQEVWYLIGAWFLGATLNAVATWWAVSLALLAHPIGNEILSRDQALTYVPVFVAVVVWLTRILIISTFSLAGERLFTQAEAVAREIRSAEPRAAQQPLPAVRGVKIIGNDVGTPAPKPMAARPMTRPAPKPEPYRPVPAGTRHAEAAAARPAEPNRQIE